MKKIRHQDSPFSFDHPWEVKEKAFSLNRNLLSESIFSIGNGYLGMRGSFEEGLIDAPKSSIEGIYLSGFYESVPIPQAERGYGFAVNSQTLLNVTDSKAIELELDGERLNLLKGEILSFKRILDMKKGYLFREMTWRSPQGKEVKITVKRLASFVYPHLLAFQYRVEPLNFSGKITIRSSINGAVDNHMHEEEDPRYSASLGGLGLSGSAIRSWDTGAVLNQKTTRSGLSLSCSMENAMVEGSSFDYSVEQIAESATVALQGEARQNQPVTLEKFVAYYTSRDHPDSNLADLAEEMTDKGCLIGFQSLLEEQTDYLNRFWEATGLAVKGDPPSEQALRFNLFHLMQAGICNGGVGIPAKGLTSEGYDGHNFWDTEIYMVPVFAMLYPEKARRLLEYRYKILDHARSRARELAHRKGALFPWRTIAGEEGSAYFPAGTAQYHINAAVAYAVRKYLEITGDYSFMLDCGAEMLFETARLWEDLGAYIPGKGGKFCLNEVTGPDEYTALVSNNCYTNYMAQWHLSYAYETAQILKEKYPESYTSLAEKLNLREEELAAWRKAAENMYIPYDHTLQIHPQDDSFFDKEPWDLSKTPAEKFPLMLHYHPLVIYRHQVCKQSDIILAQLLLEDHFSLEQRKRDYNYYEPITTHDSSLSPSIFSMVASQLGYRQDAYRFFEMSAGLDLNNILDDTHYGLHMANIAGSWLCLVNGFAGMKTREGRLSFDPYCPGGWCSYRFRLKHRGHRLEVTVDHDRAIYKLLEGESLVFSHKEQEVKLMRGEKAECRL